MTEVTNATTAATELAEQQLDHAIGGGVAVPEIVVHEADAVMHDLKARKAGGEQQDTY